MFNTRVPSHLARKATAGVAALALAASLTACSAFSDKGEGAASSQKTDGKLAVAASFYPIAYLAEKIGGDAVTVTSVTPANVEPHDFELSPKDVTSLGQEAVVLYVSGFQPSLDDAVAQLSGPQVVDLLSSVELEHHEGIEDSHDHGHDSKDADHDHDHDHDHEAEGEATTQATSAEEVHADELDPHFWLDPVRMSKAATAVEAALAKADPGKAATFEQNLKALESELTSLDSTYQAGLGQCERTTFITSHAAFGYLAERYKLTQESISGVDPESEPSPADIAAIKKVVEETGSTTIFTEELVSPTTAEAVAKETGATTEVLSPLESAPESGDYASAMSDNLSKLRAALGCK